MVKNGWGRGMEKAKNKKVPPIHTHMSSILLSDLVDCKKSKIEPPKKT